MKKHFTYGDNHGYPCYFGFGSKTLLTTIDADDMLNVHIAVLKKHGEYKVGEEIPHFKASDVSHLWGTVIIKDPDTLRAILRELNKILDEWEQELTKRKQLGVRNESWLRLDRQQSFCTRPARSEELCN